MTLASKSRAAENVRDPWPKEVFYDVSNPTIGVMPKRVEGATSPTCTGAAVFRSLIVWGHFIQVDSPECSLL